MTMADYNKQTVANLRQILKDRGIPSTGLTRKAQIIEKLEEWDTKEVASTRIQEKSHDADTELPEADTSRKDDEGTDEGREECGPVTLGNMEASTPAVSEKSEVVDRNVSEEPPKDEPNTVVEGIEEGTNSKTGTSAVQLTDASQPPDATAFERTPSSAPDEEPSIEKPPLLPIPERSGTTTVDQMTRLNTEELEAETRKRKRRSQTPELTFEDVRTKKSRPNNDKAPDIRLQEDEDKDENVVKTIKSRLPDQNVEELDQEAVEPPTNANAPKLETPVVEAPAPTERKDRGSRYRELLDQEPLNATALNTSVDDRPIEAALHPATSALYIRNLMRPLRPELLRTHLVSLASPPAASPDPSIIKSLFLDSMKTHAFVHFTTITAASRARASLHGCIWPPEGNRKELWVDFIPDDKVEAWIQQEEDAIASDKAARVSGQPVLAKKFEVAYLETADGYEAVFQVIGSAPSGRGPVTSTEWNPPTSPKGQRKESAPRLQHPVSPPSNLSTAPETRHSIAKSFATLDDLFSSTQTSKPKLYFKRVPDSTVSLRLEELDYETSRHWVPEEKRKGRGLKNAGSRREDELVRFSFDEEDRIVEVGDDFGIHEIENGGFGRRGGWGGGGGGGRVRNNRAPPRNGGFWRGGGGWRSGN